VSGEELLCIVVSRTGKLLVVWCLLEVTLKSPGCSSEGRDPGRYLLERSMSSTEQQSRTLMLTIDNTVTKNKQMHRYRAVERTRTTKLCQARTARHESYIYLHGATYQGDHWQVQGNVRSIIIITVVEHQHVFHLGVQKFREIGQHKAVAPDLFPLQTPCH